MSPSDPGVDLAVRLAAVEEAFSQRRGAAATALLGEALGLWAAGDWPPDRWRSFLDRLAAVPADVVEAVQPALAGAACALTEGGPAAPDARLVVRRLGELRVAGLIARLREQGAVGEPDGLRDRLVDALLTYGEDCVRSVGSRVLREHFARFTTPPHGLSTTAAFEPARRSLAAALRALTPDGFTGFMRLARRHVFWRLTEWARDGLRRPVVTDPQQGPLATAASAEPPPDEAAEFQVALAEVAEGLPPRDRDLLLVFFHGDKEVPGIAAEFFGEDEARTVAEFTRVLTEILPGLADRLGWSPRKVIEFMREDR